MTYYRLYFMSAWNGHIIRFAEYEAPDDQAAISLAREEEGKLALELWCEGRKVTRIEPRFAQPAKERASDTPYMGRKAGNANSGGVHRPAMKLTTASASAFGKPTEPYSVGAGEMVLSAGRCLIFAMEISRT